MVINRYDIKEIANKSLIALAIASSFAMTACGPSNMSTNSQLNLGTNGKGNGNPDPGSVSTPTPAPPVPTPTPPPQSGCSSAISSTSISLANADGDTSTQSWHTPLFNDLKASLQCQPIVWAENSIFWGQRGTANYRVMFAGAHYLYSIRFGNAAQKAKARKRVLELLKFQEEDYGHMTVSRLANEQFVVDPHTNFWIASMVAFTIGAWESNDAEVKDHMSRWWAVHFYYLKLSWTGSETRVPGTRLKGNMPSWAVDTDIYKMVSGIPVKLGKGTWAASFYFEKMLKSFPKSVPDKFVPGKLAMPLHFEQTPTGYLAWMEPSDPKPLTPVDWVKSVGPGRGQFTFGMEWKTPPPR